jgi:tetratricopeptide (TPR) repeat protein
MDVPAAPFMGYGLPERTVLDSLHAPSLEDRMIIQKMLPCILVPLLLCGCAASIDYLQQGQAQMEKKEYDAAIQSFELAGKENPEDAGISREMGIAYYHKKEFNKAKPLLLKAFITDTTDGRALFYLGTTYESLKDYPHAMDIYRRYTEVSPKQKVRSAIEARLTGLMRKQMEEEAGDVLAREASINPSTIPDNSVAVLYFKNMGKKKDLDPIQKGLADMVITDLSKVKKIKVVERVRMQKMIEEMGLGQTGLVDETTSPRMGKLLGASKLIQGSFMDLAKEAVRLDAGVVQVKPGKDIQPQKIQGKMAKFFQLEKDLVFGILDRMAVPLTQAEKDDIRIIPTENLLAFMAYCRALDYEDRGMLRESRQEYQKAIELDPKFQPASQGSSRVDRLTAAQMSVTRLEDIFIQETVGTSTATTVQAQAPASKTQKNTQASKETRNAPASASTVAENPITATVSSPVVDQMMHTAGVLDQGFLPGIDSRKPTQDGNQSSFGNAASFEIHIPLPLE